MPSDSFFRCMQRILLDGGYTFKQVPVDEKELARRNKNGGLRCQVNSHHLHHTATTMVESIKCLYQRIKGDEKIERESNTLLCSYSKIEATKRSCKSVAIVETLNGLGVCKRHHKLLNKKNVKI